MMRILEHQRHCYCGWEKMSQNAIMKRKKKKATLFSIKSVNYIRKLEYFWKKGTREVQSLIASGVIQGYSTDSGVLLRQG